MDVIVYDKSIFRLQTALPETVYLRPTQRSRKTHHIGLLRRMMGSPGERVEYTVRSPMEETVPYILRYSTGWGYHTIVSCSHRATTGNKEGRK